MTTASEDNTSSEMMTIREIATVMGASPMTVYRLVHQGVLPAVRISARCLRVRRAAFDEYLAQHEVEATQGEN